MKDAHLGNILANVPYLLSLEVKKFYDGKRARTNMILGLVSKPRGEEGYIRGSIRDRIKQIM